MMRVCFKCSEPRAISDFRKAGTELVDVCIDGETIVCKACSVALNRFAFTDTSVYDHFSHGRQVVCTLCSASGCSNKNQQLYTCEGPCSQQFGHLRFDPARLLAHTKARARLCCTECVAAERARARQT